VRPLITLLGTAKGMKKRTLLSWSSGKDSAWALHLLRQDPGIELLGLFTVMNGQFNRVSMHSTRRELLQRQADAVGLPLQTINLPYPCTNERYDTIMRQFVMESAADEVTYMAFGDLALEDIRVKTGLREQGLKPYFLYGEFQRKSWPSTCCQQGSMHTSAVSTSRSCLCVLQEGNGQEN